MICLHAVSSPRQLTRRDARGEQEAERGARGEGFHARGSSWLNLGATSAMTSSVGKGRQAFWPVG